MTLYPPTAYPSILPAMGARAPMLPWDSCCRTNGSEGTAPGLWSPTRFGSALTLYTNETSLVGSPIGTINNLGTAGGAFTGAGGSRPSVTTINGLPAPLFDGVNNALTGGPAQNAIMSAGPYSVIAAYKHIALTATAATSGWNEPNALQDSAGGNIYPIAVITTGIRSGHFDVADKQTAVINPATGTTYVIVVTFDGSTISLTLNSTTQTVAAGNPSVGATTLTLGQSQVGLKVNFALPELMFVNRLATTAEIAAARAYLVAKWGATP